jgi:hypothetical protein
LSTPISRRFRRNLCEAFPPRRAPAVDCHRRLTLAS